MAGVNPVGNPRDIRFGVFDGLRLIEDGDVKLLAKEHLLIAREQGIGREHDVALADLREKLLALGPVQREYRQLGCKPLRFIEPVRQNARWTNNKRGFSGSATKSAFMFFAGEKSQRLNGLAKPHVIG